MSLRPATSQTAWWRTVILTIRLTLYGTLKYAILVHADLSSAPTGPKMQNEAAYISWVFLLVLYDWILNHSKTPLSHY